MSYSDDIDESSSEYSESILSDFSDNDTNMCNLKHHQIYEVDVSKYIIKISHYPFFDDTVCVDAYLGMDQINNDTICLEAIETYPKTETKKGFGTNLLNYIIEYCKIKGYKYLLGNILEENFHYLSKWYPKHGFVLGSYKFNNRFFVMRKEL